MPAASSKTSSTAADAGGRSAIAQSNDQLLKAFQSQLSTLEDTYITAAMELSRWLGGQSAYYPEAQPAIVRCFETAVHALQAKSSSDFVASDGKDTCFYLALKYEDHIKACKSIMQSLAKHRQRFTDIAMKGRCVFLQNLLARFTLREETEVNVSQIVESPPHLPEPNISTGKGHSERVTGTETVTLKSPLSQSKARRIKRKKRTVPQSSSDSEIEVIAVKPVSKKRKTLHGGPLLETATHKQQSSRTVIDLTEDSPLTNSHTVTYPSKPATAIDVRSAKETLVRSGADAHLIDDVDDDYRPFQTMITSPASPIILDVDQASCTVLSSPSATVHMAYFWVLATSIAGKLELPFSLSDAIMTGLEAWKRHGTSQTSSSVEPLICAMLSACKTSEMRHLRLGQPGASDREIVSALNHEWPEGDGFICGLVHESTGKFFIEAASNPVSAFLYRAPD